MADAASPPTATAAQEAFAKQFWRHALDYLQTEDKDEMVCILEEYKCTETILWMFIQHWYNLIDHDDDEIPFHPKQFYNRCKADHQLPRTLASLADNLKLWLANFPSLMDVATSTEKMKPDESCESDVHDRPWPSADEVVQFAGDELECNKVECEWLGWWPTVPLFSNGHLWTDLAYPDTVICMDWAATLDDEDKRSAIDELRHGDSLDFTDYRGCGVFVAFGWDAKNLLLLPSEDEFGYRVPTLMAWRCPLEYTTSVGSTGRKYVSKAILPLAHPEIRQHWVDSKAGSDSDAQMDYDPWDSTEFYSEDGNSEQMCQVTWLLCRRMNDVFARIVMVLQHTLLPHDVHQCIAGYFLPKLPPDLLTSFPPKNCRTEAIPALRHCLYGPTKGAQQGRPQDPA